jgi:serine/threonine protein kinase
MPPSNGSDKNEFDFTPIPPIDVDRTLPIQGRLDKTSNLPPDPFEEDLTGQLIGQNFRIISKLGAGGMSVVYRAHNEMLKKDVAIKVLHPHLVTNRMSLERFRQEAQAASQIDHENVVRIIDFGIAAGSRPYIVMDYLEGHSLSEWIKKEGQLELDRAIEIFVQLADALSYAHQKGIIHRDLKPSNVILVPRRKAGGEVAKIVDFGIAKLQPHEGADAAALTQTGDVFGSPLYMSPEQCKGEKLDNRSDIYSLGCLMYETLTGVTPINGANMLEILYRHMNEMPRSMKKVAPSLKIPQQIEAIVFKALAKEPANRYNSMEELRQDLEEFRGDNSHWLNNFKAGWLLFKAKRRKSSSRDKIALTLSVMALLTLIFSFSALGLLYTYGQDKPAQLDELDWYSVLSEAGRSAETIDVSSLGTRNVLQRAREQARKIKELTAEKKLDPLAIGDPEEINSQLAQIIAVAGTSFKEKRYAEAADIYENALTICRFVNGNESFTDAEILISLFRAEYYSGKYRDSIAHMNQLQRLNSNFTNRVLDTNLGMAVVSSYLGDSYYRTGDVASARKYFYQAMEGWESRQKRDTVEDFYGQDIEPIAYARYGDIFFKDNLYKEALKYYRRAFPCFEQAKNSREGDYNMALCSFKMALCQLYLHEFAESDKLFQSAIKLLKKHHGDEKFSQTIPLLYQINASEQAKQNRMLGAISGFVEAGLQKFTHHETESDSK